MPEMRRYRSLSIVVSAIAVSALVGGLFGKSLLATDDKVPDHYRAFTAALGAIETSYVDAVDSDRLVYGAVRGMLSTLDPHSSFFDPREYAQMRERQEGHYYGIGIQISSIDGEVIAQFVFEGSPSYKQGVRQGDVLARIAGEDTKSWNCATPAECTDRAMKRLRGPRGSPVQISLRRRGYAQLIPVELVRDEITIPTVPAFFMIDATTGYIQLRDFGENTDRDLRRALQNLAPKGMRRLLLDIRNNPGGPLDQAIKVVNEFTPRGKMIVYTRGRVSEFRPGLPRDRRRRVHRHPHRHDGEPEQRQRVGNRHRCAAGSRSRLRRRRDDVREGARAVDLPHQRRRGPGPDDGALLHAERTVDSAAVGRDLRRIPDVHHARSGRQQAAQRERLETHRRRTPGLQRRRHRAGQASGRTSSRDSTRRDSGVR